MADNVPLIGRILQKYDLVTVQQFNDVVQVYETQKQRHEQAGRISLGELLRDHGHLTPEQVAWLEQAVNHYEKRGLKARAKTESAPTSARAEGAPASATAGSLPAPATGPLSSEPATPDGTEQRGEAVSDSGATGVTVVAITSQTPVQEGQEDPLLAVAPVLLDPDGDHQEPAGGRTTPQDDPHSAASPAVPTSPPSSQSAADAAELVVAEEFDKSSAHAEGPADGPEASDPIDPAEFALDPPGPHDRGMAVPAAFVAPAAVGAAGDLQPAGPRQESATAPPEPRRRSALSSRAETPAGRVVHPTRTGPTAVRIAIGALRPNPGDGHRRKDGARRQRDTAPSDHRGPSGFASDHRGPSGFASDHRGPSGFASDHRGPSGFASDVTRAHPTDAARLQTPISDLLALLLEAQRQDASDAHLHVGAPPFLRVAGELRPLPGFRALTAQDHEEILAQSLTLEERRRFRERGDCTFLYTSAVGRFRGAALRHRQGCDLSFRLIPARIPRLEDLGLTGLSQVLTGLQSGLLLCTGPAGCGKTSTMAAVIDFFHRHLHRCHRVLIVEDPIEFVHPPKHGVIHQRQVGTHTESMEAALETAPFEGYDLIGIGEINTAETAALALGLAGSGRLVVATAPAGNAARAIEWLLDLFPRHRRGAARAALSHGLGAIIAQRLIRRSDGPGRVAITENLLCTPAIAALIQEDRLTELRAHMLEERTLGMSLLDEALLSLARSGVVSFEEARAQAQIPGLV